MENEIGKLAVDSMVEIIRILDNEPADDVALRRVVETCARFAECVQRLEPTGAKECRSLAEFLA
jgi:hypothetical protein